jgi:ABC-2 type transport system permease protein
MHKILLIIKREYLSRVKKKSFLIATFLVPLLFVGMMTLVGYLTAKQGELGDKKKVVVVDESGRFEGRLKNSSTLLYTFSKSSIVAEKKTFIDSGYDYLLCVPASLTGIQLLGEKKPNAFTGGNIEEALTGIIRQQRLIEAGIDTALLAKAQKPLSVKSLQFTEHGLKDAQSGVAFGVGMAAAFLI